VGRQKAIVLMSNEMKMTLGFIFTKD